MIPLVDLVYTYFFPAESGTTGEGEESKETPMETDTPAAAAAGGTEGKESKVGMQRLVVKY